MESRGSTLIIAGTVIALVSGCAAHQGARAQPSEASAATEAARPTGAVILVRTPRHLLAALKTAREGRADPEGFARYRILVCGEAVSAIQAGSELEPLIRAAATSGIQITACGMSLAELNIDAGALIDSVDLVPNALAEALHLQSRGWASVEL